MDSEISFVLDCILKLFLSIVFGFVLGIERKSRSQVVGTRTLILICISSCLLCILSSYMTRENGSGDGTRIAAGVVSGIGFLGGGAILRQGMNIKGLTSAAIIWATSALGMAIGTGLYFQSLFVLIAIVFLLVVLEKLEVRLFPAGKIKTLHLCFLNESVDMKELKLAIEKNGMIVCDINMSQVLASKQIILHYSVKCPKEESFGNLIGDLKKIGDLSEFSITD